MRKFREMNFFHILESLPQAKADHSLLINAYEEFAESLFSESEGASNLTLFYNQLCYTHAELQSLHNDNIVIKKIENTSALSYLNKALLLMDAQIKLVKWKMKIGCSPQIKQERQKKDKIKWTGTIIELVEFGYASLESKSFNNGEIEIKELIDYLSTMFDFEVKDCYRVFVDIRHRNGDRTLYLDKLKDKLMQKMEKVDNKDR